MSSKFLKSFTTVCEGNAHMLCEKNEALIFGQVLRYTEWHFDTLSISKHLFKKLPEQAQQVFEEMWVIKETAQMQYS